MRRTGIEEGMNAEEKSRLEAYMGRQAKAIAADENGIPKHIIRAVLDDPDRAQAKYGGKYKHEEDSRSEYEVSQDNEEENFRKRAGEGKEEYFVRVLRTKANDAGLVFPSKRAADDYFLDTAADLTRAEEGAGFKSSLKNATVMIAKKQMEMITARIAEGRKKLLTVEQDSQKEVKKKSAAGKLALEYNKIKRAAEKKERDVAENTRNLREWSKKATELEFSIKELGDKIKANKKELESNMMKAKVAEEDMAVAKKAVNEADEGRVSAEEASAKAKADALGADSDEEQAEAKNEIESSAEVLTKAITRVRNTKEVLTQADASDTAAASAVLLCKTKGAALQQELRKAQEDHKRAVAFQQMYEEKAEGAKSAAVEGEDKLADVEKAFVEEVLVSVHNTKIIKVHSATYMCPDQIDPTTKLAIPEEEALAKVEGNQNANLMKVCEGQTSCKYDIFPAILGEAAPGCSEYTYNVKYSCEIGPVVKPKPVEEPKAANSTEVSEETSTDEAAAADADDAPDADSFLQLPDGLFGEGKAQAEENQMKSDLGQIKEELAQEQVAKKVPSADLKDLATTDAIQQLKINMGKAEPDADPLGLHSAVKKKQPIEEVSLPAGAGDRSISIACVQQQDPNLMRTEAEVDRLKSALADAKQRLGDEANNEEDKLETAIAEDKAKAENAQTKVVDAKAQIDIDRNRLEELKVELQGLQTELSSAADANKAKVQVKIDAVIQEKATIQARIPNEGAAKTEADAAVKSADATLADAKAALVDPPHTELAQPQEIQDANQAVKDAEANLKDQKIVVAKLTDMLTKETKAAVLATITGHLAEQVKLQKEMTDKVAREKKLRDEVILGVSKRLQQENASKLAAAEKKAVENQVKIQALTWELGNATSSAEHTKLKAELAKAKEEAARDKAAALAQEYAPALSEAAVVSKLEKKELVAQRQRELKEQEENDKITNKEVDGALNALKTAADPTAVAAATKDVLALKKEQTEETEETAEKTKEVTDALAVEAQGGTALVNNMEKNRRCCEKGCHKAREQNPGGPGQNRHELGSDGS
jgi:hypothetical protein